MSILKVFISYSYDSPEHLERIRKFAVRLKKDRVDVRIDMDGNAAPPEGWPNYSQNQIQDADYVLLICTETYCRRFEGREESGRGQGITFEGRIIRNLIYHSPESIAKFIPVMMDAEDSANIPLLMRDRGRYLVSEDAGYESLLRFLRPEASSSRRPQAKPAKKAEPTHWFPASASSKAKPLRNPAMKPPIDFVIITPLEEEREAMLNHLGRPKRSPPTNDDIRVYYPAVVPVTFTDGSTGQYKVVVTDLLGMGRVEAANAVGDAVRRWRPKYVLLVGIAGGLGKAGVQLGDVLISEQIADYELQKLTAKKTNIRWSVHRADQRLLAAAKQVLPDVWRPLVREARPEAGQPKRHFGPICTGDKVVANGLIEQYAEIWTKLIGVEMEGGGVASAAFQAASTPGFFMVRGVSDLADPDKDKAHVDIWRTYACDIAAAYVEAFIKSGPVVPISKDSGQKPQVGSSHSGGASPVGQTSSARVNLKDDISRIIKYAPTELIGREDELQLLNDACAKIQTQESKRPHILTFVALGGEGKTSLVAKWAAEMAHKDWPGCDAAFAWSFYSQGTRELPASSDLFLKEALTFFGDQADKAFASSPAGAFEKGQRLARLVGQRRSLLILDGLEPLQYAPTSPTPGQLKDQGIAALLKGLAATSHGLCVVTTRYSLSDLRAFWQTTAPEVKLLRLSRDSGVHLLQSLGVKGSPLRNIPFHGGREQVNEFEKLVEDVKGHALTLNLLGTYLRDAHAGDIRESWRVAVVAIEREFETFTGPDRAAFRERLIAALGVPAETVRINKVVKGSCVVLLEFETKEAFVRFVAAAVNRDPRLQGFQHEWTVTDMRMVADLPAVQPSLPNRSLPPELVTKGTDSRIKIPNSMIYVIGDVLGGWYYSHTKLNTLFGGNGFPGEPPAGNCVHKSQEWLKRANSQDEEDPLELLGRVLTEFMNLDRQDTPQWKDGFRRITEVLSKNGFAFDVNGLVPTERVRPQASTQVESLNPDDPTPRNPSRDQRLDRQTTGALNSSATSARTPMTPELKPIFISYAHEDNDNADRSRRWLDRLTQFLQPLVEQDELTICSDQDIGLGDDWHAHIQKHLNGARAAVLLVSPAFLASKYVRNSELPILLRNAKENGVKIIPVILRRCLFEETKFRYPDPKAGPEEFTLASLQASNSPTKPLSGMTEDEQDEVLLKVARALIRLTSTNP